MRNRSLTPGRFDRWLGSWRVALRISAREARRSPGRGLLVLALIGLPVAAITFAIILFRSAEPPAGALVDRTFGQADARVVASTTCPGVSGDSWTVCFDPVDDAAAPAPTEHSDLADQIAHIQEVTAGEVVPVRAMTAYIGTADRRINALQTYPDSAAVEGMITLDAGRWPSAPGEVLITPAGEDAGLPTSGAFTAGLDGAEAELEVVGLASAPWSGFLQADLVARPDAPLTPLDSSENPAWSYLIVTERDLGAEDLRAWVEAGFEVSAREYFDAPPPELQLGGSSGPDPTMLALLVAVAAGLALETMLLAAPAFAIGAARQRHSLALSSGQGAGPAQLRRMVLSQGLVLGLVGAVGGILLGTVAAAGYQWWQGRANPRLFSPTVVPVTWLLLLGVLALGSAVAAAWWPARGVSWLNTMAVLRGTVVAPRVKRGAPVLGLILVIAGLVIAVAGSPSGDIGGVFVGAGFVLVPLGVLLLIPATLALATRLSGPFPFAVRLATRDNLRQRSKAVPTVAAIFGAVLAATALMTALAGNDSASRASYLPSGPVGSAYAWASSDAEREAVREAVRGVREAGGTPIEVGFAATTSTHAPTVEIDTGLYLIDARCSAAQIESGEDLSCRPEYADTGFGRSATVLPVDVAEQFPEFDAEALDTLAGGGVVLHRATEGFDLDPAAPVTTLTTVQIDEQAFAYEGKTVVADGPFSDDVLLSVALVGEPVERDVDGAPVQTHQPPWGLDSGLIVTPETAAQLGWETSPSRAYAWAGDGSSLSQEAVDAINQAGAAAGLHFTLETGQLEQSDLARVMSVIMLVLGGVALIAALVGTALHMSETRADSATLSAIGADTAFRRAVAAAHAGGLCLVGGGLGLVTGLVLGAAATVFSATGMSGASLQQALSLVVVPWQPLLLVAALVALAGASAWALVRQAPQLTRRTV